MPCGHRARKNERGGLLIDGWVTTFPPWGYSVPCTEADAHFLLSDCDSDACTEADVQFPLPEGESDACTEVDVHFLLSGCDSDPFGETGTRRLERVLRRRLGYGAVAYRVPDATRGGGAHHRHDDVATLAGLRDAWRLHSGQ